VRGTLNRGGKVPGVSKKEAEVMGEFANRTRVHRTGRGPCSQVLDNSTTEPEPYWVWTINNNVDNNPVDE